jgi:hypothetical protein
VSLRNLHRRCFALDQKVMEWVDSEFS